MIVPPTARLVGLGGGLLGAGFNRAHTFMVSAPAVHEPNMDYHVLRWV